MDLFNVVLGLCFFIVPMWAYRKGLNDGIRITQNKPLEPIKTPIEVVNNVIKQRNNKKEEDRVLTGINNILSYDGTPQKGVDD